MQRISVHGVPETSHFARVLVAADYRMKRLAMNFDPSPVRGLPSYLQMVKPSARTVLSPRFWLEPKYEALLRDAEGLAFELRGSGVKAMTEEDFIAASGNVQHSGKAEPAAQHWADIMTEKYPELAVADPIFGQLQNCMELADRRGLGRERTAGGEGRLQHADAAGIARPSSPTVFNAPKQVESKASVLKKGTELGHQRLGRRGDQLLGAGRQGPNRRRGCPRSHQGRAGRKRQLVVELRTIRRNAER